MATTAVPMGLTNRSRSSRSACSLRACSARPASIGWPARCQNRPTPAKYPTRQHQQKPIVRVRELTKSAGDEVTFDLVNPVKSIPIMGDEWAQGKGSVLTFAQDRLRINQARFPISAGGAMSQQRTPHQLRPLAQDVALSSLGDSLIRHLWSISPAHVDSTTTSSGACRLRRMPTSQR